ncbi:PEP-CTERM sorting domain-containing protein [Pseudoduganella lutea]|uniref:PEP-CTERM sorting domain-containing protein n=1 Tax=Pseudoduganella lutea TaxID=321985 RepID=UPI001E2B85B0|nr:PEP-CTERM sorting domain-containing protein [Pseudoduganella lutea]
MAALILASSAFQAHAALITMEYTAVITQMFETESIWPYTDVPVQSNDFTGFSISVGQTVTGTFSYDTETGLGRDGNWEMGYNYYLSGAKFQQTLKFENSSKVFSFETSDNLITTAYDDPYMIRTEGWSDETYMASLRGRFNHPAADSIAEGYLPAANQWNGFADDSFVEFRQSSYLDFTTMMLRADITDIRVISAVPEPSTYLMLGAGLCMVALARRSRRAPPTAHA